MSLRTTLLILLSIISLNLSAQRRGRGYSRYRQRPKTAVVDHSLSDSINAISRQYSQQIDSLSSAIRYGTNLTVSKNGNDIGSQLGNPYYYPLFAGNTLFLQPITNVFGSLPKLSLSGSSVSLVPPAYQSTQEELVKAYASHPEIIQNNLIPTLPGFHYYNRQRSNAADSLQQALQSKPHNETLRKNAADASNAPVIIEKGSQQTPDILDISDFHIHVRRPNFWTLKGSFSMQFMQYYVSDNWYKGGDNHISMLGAFNMEANYDNKQKFTFNNKLETKLGFQSAASDTHHKFKTNADLLRLTDKVGLQAFNHWYYTLMLQSWTQFYKAYNANSDDVTSDFMSPFESVLSLGMDYKLSKKRVNLTATFSPLAMNLKSCQRDALTSRYGIDEGKHVKTTFGSTATVNMTLKLCNQVNWVTRFYTFYDYHNLKVEWENTINLKVNKYLSSKLFLYPRFDNSVQKKEDSSYFQFNEYISVGLDVNF